VQLSDDELKIVAGLLDEVLELPESEWWTWLDKRAGLPDAFPAPLLRVLREMMAAEAKGECTLPPIPNYPEAELAEFADLANATELAPETSVDLLPMSQIGPYRLIRELGRGGMGAVWLAERNDGALKRQVALKLPHSNLPHRKLAERFARERDILAALVHPHVARLYDAGVAVTPQGQPYLALEYVDGQPLNSYCEERQLDLPARLALFLQVLSAVQYAHGQLVVHRDLKPSNILVSADGQVRLLDFGIAKMLVDGEVQETELTELGGRALTLRYAAPEQILGRPIGTAADVYGLGVVLYELLTGVLPYRLRRDSRGALEEAILNAEPTLPSQAVKAGPEAAGRARRLRGDLDTIVLKALKKEPAARYATAAAFADDLNRYLRGEPVLAQPDSAWYRGRKFLLRHRLGAALAVLVIAALGTGLGVALWQANVARQEARTAKAVKDFMQDVFLANSSQQADPQKARQLTARELLDIGAEKIDAALADAPEAKLEMLKIYAEMYGQLGEFDRSAAFAERRVALVRQVYGRDSGELAEALLVTALAQRLVNIDHPGQRAALDEAQAIMNRRGDDQSQERAALLMVSADYYSDYDFPRASDYAQRALDLSRSMIAERADFPVNALKAAAIFLQAGNAAAARTAATEGIAEGEVQNAAMVLGTGAYIHLPQLHERLGQAEWELGDRASAEKQLREAWRAARQTFGDHDMDTLCIQARLADLLLLTGHRDEGGVLLDVAAGALERRPADRPSRYLFLALAMVGHAQADAGQYPAALANLAKALAMRSTIDASPAVAEILRDQSRVLMAMHRDAEATEALDRAVAMRVKSGLQNPAVERQEAELRARLVAPQPSP
jgi:eukaryotic-like serine/threonine-protein kinase